MTHLIIDTTGLVINTVLWDGKTPWQPPENCIALKPPKASLTGVGWRYVNGEFIPPSEPEPEPTPVEEPQANA